jgi:carboxyl-terminal processing protease
MSYGDDERKAEQGSTPPGSENQQTPNEGAPSWPPAPAPSWPPAPAPSWPPAPQSGWAPPSPQPTSWPAAPHYPPPGQSPWGAPAAPQSPATPQPPEGWPPAPDAAPQTPEGWQPQPSIWQTLPPQSTPPSRPSRLPLIFSVVAVALIAFTSGMVVDHVSTPAAEQQAPLDGFDVYLQALRDVRQNYVGRDSLTDQQLLYGSIRGMVDSLGDTNHTTFMTPEEYAALQNELSGSVAGIGVLISQDNGAFIVARVIRGSPADEAGILEGDQITAVDGASVIGLTFDQLATKVRGDVGTEVTVTVIHPKSTEPVDITMTRAEVSAPLVDWNLIPGTKIADIALYEFSAGAADQVGEAIDSATAQGATGIVLDLRGNPGGYAGEATSVLGEFVSSGVAYIEEDANGKRTEVNVDTKRKTTSLPLVVLVDGYTASAAEVVAGCLQDRGRGTIVGMNTIGTGTILLPFPLSDGSVILLGVRDWLTPDGKRIFGVGISPDYSVALPQGALPLDPYHFDKMTKAQLDASGDAQLLKAVDLLSK